MMWESANMIKYGPALTLSSECSWVSNEHRIKSEIIEKVKRKPDLADNSPLLKDPVANPNLRKRDIYNNKSRWHLSTWTSVQKTLKLLLKCKNYIHIGEMRKEKDLFGTHSSRGSQFTLVGESLLE